MFFNLKYFKFMIGTTSATVDIDNTMYGYTLGAILVYITNLSKHFGFNFKNVVPRDY